MEITVHELLEKIGHATKRMSRKNPHRLLLIQCAQAFVQILLNPIGALTQPGMTVAEQTPESPVDASETSQAV